MNSIPEISVHEFSSKLSNKEDIIVLDVREAYELQYAAITDECIKVVPLSKLARELGDALPEKVQTSKEVEIVVMCHTGSRSAQVTAWLRQNGWTNVYNLAGGIDDYAREIDPSVGFY